MFEPKIEFENVSYKFSKNDNRVLDDVSLKIESGECVGIIGSSGVGKSTMLDLILGLYSPTKGEIKVSGLPPKTAISVFPTSISYVPQEVTLFPGTIRENIAIGYKESEVDDQKIWKSLEQVSLRDFVQQLPGSLDYVISERGVNLSGGQKQRIGLARALYSEPRLLLLDEATSALDSQTEKDIIDTLRALRNQITVIFVTHRLTTLQLFNKVYRIKNGKISLESENSRQKKN
jgi:ABC-type bacteriocin/lantibiotic exporter with double-glycine peptidase domain